MAATRTLDDFFRAARPIIEHQLDLAVQAAELGKAAREVGFEWSQIKAVLKATIQDEEDGGERVQKLIGKNECGIAYADIAAKVNKKNFPDATVAVAFAKPVETKRTVLASVPDDLDVRTACDGALRRT